MKDSAVYKICVGVVVLAVAGILFFSGLTGRLGKGSNGSLLSEKLLDKDMTEEVTDIAITTSSSDITFKKSTNDNYRVFISGKSTYYASASVVNKVLTVNYDDSECFSSCSGDIVVYVPSTFENNITILSANGDINVLDLDNASINITLNNGDIKLGNIYNVDITNNNGDIRIGTISNRIELHNNNGDISISALNMKEYSSIETNLGDIKIGKISDVSINATTSVGTLNIAHNNPESNITLDAKTNLGEITIK